MAFIYRSDMHLIQADVTGVNLPATFVWDSCAGGDIAADNAYYHGGNMAPAVPAGGLRTPTDITITVAWRSDVYPYYLALYNAASFQTATVSVTPLSITGAINVKPLTWTGLLTSVTRAEAQAADSTIGYLTCVIAPQDSLAQN
jgi:hypothetical protein